MMTTTLALPSFLYGSYSTIQRQAEAMGLRCGEQYQRNGSFPSPEVEQVTPSDVVLTHNVVDFQEEAPAWRLYMLSDVAMSLCETDEKNHLHLSKVYELAFRKTAWGALYFVLSGDAPESAEQTAERLKAVLGFWDSLHHERYLHRRLNAFLTLEGLLTAACGWVLEAWCPETDSSLRSRLERASDRMARATREDCIETLLRQQVRLLALADRRKLKHPAVVTQLDFWRERLNAMDAASFERISGVHPGEVLGALYQWDRQLDTQ